MDPASCPNAWWSIAAKMDIREQAEDVRQFVLNAEMLEDVAYSSGIIRLRWSQG